MSQAEPISKCDARRSFLLDVAAELYLERGYDGLELDEIIERAGGSRRNVDDVFGGREGIFIASISRLCSELINPLEGVVVPHDTPESNLMRLGEHISELSRDTKTLALHRLMIAEAVRFPELSQTIYHFGRGRGVGAVEAIIEQNRNRLNEPFQKISSLSLAEMFFCLIINETEVQALIRVNREAQKSDNIDEMVRSAVTLFIKGTFQKDQANESCQ
ncbi:TetR/AcrR family transcriptional regulator [Rhizobium sp. Leaf262]|uniref:TetR/AcrR family transcriptional regulator n=1 Tax=Rhizobium sp. Leaf262 TaxID=1736312 RepID=UPI000713A2B2|nr:TetR/AcrR family transcriptional regulator [Rhizobium sp. Leaf262]KQO75936.1 hypothetical protein ASF29_12200 [Rhizobium sp. Leaf262]